MLQGFHKTYNIHAINHITKPVEIPLQQLGVEGGERLSPVKDAVRYPTRQKKVTQPELAHQSYEYSQMDGVADPIKPEDFPKEVFLGDAIAKP